jgi:hypothetical protein
MQASPDSNRRPRFLQCADTCVCGMMQTMEHTTRQGTRSIDLTGLPEDAVRAVESLVSALREHATRPSSIPRFASRDEWIQAIREWAGSHTAKGSHADWSRETIYRDE